MKRLFFASLHLCVKEVLGGLELVEEMLHINVGPVFNDFPLVDAIDSDSGIGDSFASWFDTFEFTLMGAVGTPLNDY